MLVEYLRTFEINQHCNCKVLDSLEQLALLAFLGHLCNTEKIYKSFDLAGFYAARKFNVDKWKVAIILY